jgi:ATP-dependent Zn protease
MGDATVDSAVVRATAVSTRGFSGADLENLCRSAGVFASARGAAAVGSEDLASVILSHYLGEMYLQGDLCPAGLGKCALQLELE